MGISVLSCAPLDEEALFTPMSIDLSHFFDDVEDDGGIKMEKQNSCQPEIECPKFDERPKSVVDGADYELKLESTKRKLRESYEAAATKRRAIQIIDFQPTPKQAKCCKTPRPRAHTARTGYIIRRSIRQN